MRGGRGRHRRSTRRNKKEGIKGYLYLNSSHIQAGPPTATLIDFKHMRVLDYKRGYYYRQQWRPDLLFRGVGTPNKRPAGGRSSRMESGKHVQLCRRIPYVLIIEVICCKNLTNEPIHAHRLGRWIKNIKANKHFAILSKLGYRSEP